MANISSVLAKLEFKNEELEDIKIDLEDDKYEKFVNEFIQFSYGDEGTHIRNNIFQLSGRWEFSGNFRWGDIIKLYCDAITSIEPSVKYIVIQAREMEPGAYFVAGSTFTVNAVTYDYDIDYEESYGIDEYAEIAQIAKPKEEDFEDEDDYTSEWVDYIDLVHEQFSACLYE